MKLDNEPLLREIYKILTLRSDTWAHWAINKRAEVVAKIAEHQENGYIYVVIAGMDCDCVQYKTAPFKLEATYHAWNVRERQEAEDAEGPFSMFILSPKEAKTAKSSQRDLIMEAHENGHPGTVSTVLFHYE